MANGLPGGGFTVRDEFGGGQFVAFADESLGDVEFRGPGGDTVDTGVDVNGTTSALIDLPDQPGEYDVLIGGQEFRSFEVTQSQANDVSTPPGWNGNVVTLDGEFIQREEPDDTGPEPEDVPGVVNADNPEGAALAPALRERLGNVGGTVNIGGDPVEVGPVTDDDERVANGGGDGGGLLGGIGILAALAAVVWVVMG